MNSEDTRKSTPPYIPFATLDNFCSELRELGRMPNEIDRSFLRRKSGSVQSWLPSALQYLELLDGKKPTELMETLVRSSDEERTQIYAALLRDKFADLFNSVDMEAGTTQQLSTWFKEHGIASTTVDRCIAFFLDMCARAEVPVSPYFEKTNSRRGSMRRKSPKKSNSELVSSNPNSPVADTRNPTALENTLIRGLIEQLPAPGESFPKIDRDNWLALVPLILTSVYGPPDE